MLRDIVERLLVSDRFDEEALTQVARDHRWTTTSAFSRGFTRVEKQFTCELVLLARFRRVTLVAALDQHWTNLCFKKFQTRGVRRLGAERQMDEEQAGEGSKWNSFHEDQFNS